MKLDEITLYINRRFSSKEVLYRIFNDILNERNNQLYTWGKEAHELEVWNLILNEEVGEFAEAILAYRFRYAHIPKSEYNELHKHTDETLHNLRYELIQIAAVSVAILYDIDTRLKPE